MILLKEYNRADDVNFMNLYYYLCNNGAVKFGGSLKFGYFDVNSIYEYMDSLDETNVDYETDFSSLVNLVKDVKYYDEYYLILYCDKSIKSDCYGDAVFEFEKDNDITTYVFGDCLCIKNTFDNLCNYVNYKKCISDLFDEYTIPLF